jgi:hypothetical protein
VSNVKSKFTVHTEYKNFGLGEDLDKVLIKVFSPFISNAIEFAIFSLFGTLSLLIGLCSALIFIYLIYIDRQFLREGQQITAIVTSCRMKRDSDGKISTIVPYEYTVLNVVYKDATLLSGHCDNYPVGTPLDGRYLPSIPSISRISQDSEANKVLLNTAMFGLVGFISTYVGLRTMWLVSRYLYARRSIAAKLIVLEGEITSITSEMRGRLHYVRVRYSFETPRKKTVIDSIEVERQDLERKTLPPTGTPVAVLYSHDTNYYTIL